MEEGKFTFNCIQAHATVQLGRKRRGGLQKKTTKTRSVCGPSNPVVWYTAPLKLTVVFIVALEISLVKLQAWPVNQGCLSLPAAHSPPKNPRLWRARRFRGGWWLCVCVCVCVVNLYQHLYLCVCVCVEVLKLFVSLGRVECTDSSFLMQITLMISCYNLHTFDKDELVIEDVWTRLTVYMNRLDKIKYFYCYC